MPAGKTLLQKQLEKSRLNYEELQTVLCKVETIPIETGRKLNVHKTFRSRPERLLNVLCTFSLRPVSTWILNN